MTQPLFLRKRNSRELFIKEASGVKLPDDHNKWNETILSELHRLLPYITGSNLSLEINSKDTEAGFAFGYAVLRNTGSVEAGAPTNNSGKMIRIPVIVDDRVLQPFHVFSIDSKTVPLNRRRYEEAMDNPKMFAGASTPSTSPGPDLQGLTTPPAGRNGHASQGQGNGQGGQVTNAKLASAKFEDLDPAQLKRMATLKSYEDLDKANKDMSDNAKRRRTSDAVAASVVTGTALGVGKHLIGKGNNSLIKRMSGGNSGKVLKSMGVSAAKGVGTGLLLGAATKGISRYKASKRDKDRNSSEFEGLIKKASLSDIPKGRADNGETCSTCKHYSNSEGPEGYCTKFDAVVSDSFSCPVHVKADMAKSASISHLFRGNI